jgi:HAD superfamily hydrolase (TIGR01450 family)
VILVERYDLVVFDLDGVVYVGTGAVPGAAQAIRAVVDAGVAVAYATNNASRRASEVAQLLNTLGVPARTEEVVTSARATAEMLARELPPGAPVLPVGAPALREELAASGLTPVGAAEDRPVAVVQGYGPEVGWAALAEACVAIRAGAQWIATNNDATMPSPRGPVPGNGSLVAALSAALGGRQPDVVVGKPEPILLMSAAGGRAASRVLVVGDRLDTDVEGAGRAGMASLLVLTGVTTAAELLAAPPDRRPMHVAADCAALVAPAHASEVPACRGGVAVAGAWRVTIDDDHLILGAGGTGPAEPVDALRALASAAWASPQWSAIQVLDSAAEQALTALGLGRYESWAFPTVAT